MHPRGNAAKTKLFSLPAQLLKPLRRIKMLYHMMVRGWLEILTDGENIAARPAKIPTPTKSSPTSSTK